MGEPIRILQLTATIMIGGAERMILSLGESIDRSRFELHVCSLYPLPKTGFHDQFQRVNLPTYLINAPRFYDPRSIAALRRYVVRHEIDIIHTHVLDVDILGQLVGILTRRPVITTLHSVPLSYDRQRPDRRFLHRLTMRYVARWIVAVSDMARAAFHSEWGIPEERMRTIYPAVPLEPYLALPAYSPDDAAERLAITTVGRLVPAKAQHLLLEAVRDVIQQHPHVHVYVVGPGPREQELREQARTLGIADNVIFTGAHHDVPAILAKTDIFVISSLWEGFGLSAIEAMAAGRPVIMTDVAGCRELVEDGKHALVVAAGDVGALREAIVSLVGDPDRRRALGHAARERVRDALDIDSMTKRYEELYESLRP